MYPTNITGTGIDRVRRCEGVAEQLAMVDSLHAGLDRGAQLRDRMLDQARRANATSGAVLTIGRKVQCPDAVDFAAWMDARYAARRSRQSQPILHNGIWHMPTSNMGPIR